MTPNDLFKVTSKVTGTMKVKTTAGRTIPFTLLNIQLILAAKLSAKAIGLLAIAESICSSSKATTGGSTGGSNDSSFSALHLSHHSSDSLETIMKILFELLQTGCIERQREGKMLMAV